MQLKTVSSLGLAFLLVVGVVGVASAQEVAATQGILIRVDKPAANTWAAIDSTIEFRILTYDGRLDAGFTVSVRDSSLGDGDAAGEGGVIHYTVDVPENADSATPDAPRDNALFISLSPAIFVSKGLGSGIDTFTVQIGVTAGTTETASNHAVKVVVDPIGDEGPLNNLMEDKKITPATAGFGATRVGDGKLFGVDGARPLHGTTEEDRVFTSIALDLSKLSTDTTFQGDVRKVMIRTEDEFKVTLDLNTAQILGARADRIEVGLVPVDSITALQTRERNPLSEAKADAAAFKDDALVKLLLRGDRLYSPNPSVSMIIEAGQFADNQRLELFAYLVDVAGNVGGTAAEPAAADWKELHGTTDVLVTDTQDIEIIGDATAPTITINYPNPDSIASGAHRPRFSRHSIQAFPNSYIPMPGETREIGRWLKYVRKPLSFDVSEVPDSVKITHGDSTHSLGSSGGRSPTFQDAWSRTNDSTLVASIFWRYDEPGGVQEDLTIEVWDSLGNTNSLILADIWYDQLLPTISNLFPTGERTNFEGTRLRPRAPRNADNEDAPTVNLTTKNPAFLINEELDSLSIRYHEEGGGTPIVQSFRPGNPLLEKVDELVTWEVNDTAFVESQRYHLQILAFDLAGNGRLADGGTPHVHRGLQKSGTPIVSGF